MKLPETVQVGQTQYEVEVVEQGLQDNDGGEVPAVTRTTGKIFINDKMKDEIQEGALVGELLKAINNEVTLGLNGQQIQVLGNNLLPLLKQNGFELKYVGKEEAEEQPEVEVVEE